MDIMNVDYFESRDAINLCNTCKQRNVICKQRNVVCKQRNVICK